MALTILVICLVLLITACSSVPEVDWELEFSGDVGNPYTVSYMELTKMKIIDLQDVLMEKSVGEDEVGSWSGIPFKDLLEKADASENVVTVTAIAADGYAIEISKAEYESSILALKKDGEWIQKVDPDHGPIRLVCPNMPANRWVFQLIEIQVNEK